MAIDTSTPRSRRAILAGALGGAGALIAHAIGGAASVAAATGDPVLLGKGTTPADNAATAVTIVNATGFSALGGVSNVGTGLEGRSQGPGAVSGGRSTGVIGSTGSALDPLVSTNETGVYGVADDSVAAAGVWGDSVQGTGVVGTGDWGVAGIGAVGVIGWVDSASTGVYGFAGDLPIDAGPPFPVGGSAITGIAGAGAFFGVYAKASTSSQTALYVNGKARFSRSGRVTIASTSTSRKVFMTGVTPGSWVLAMLQTSVGGCSVRAVVPTTGAFTIYLSKAPGKRVAIGYLVVN